MAHPDFLHLRVRNACSLSKGAIRLDELIVTRRAWWMPAVAVADRAT